MEGTNVLMGNSSETTNEVGSMETHPYTNDFQYIRDEFRRLDLRLQIELLRAGKAGFRVAGDLWQGDDCLTSMDLCQIEKTIQAEPHGAEHGESFHDHKPSGIREAKEALALLAGEISRRKEATFKNGATLFLYRLAEILNLTAFETDTLLVCLAPELDLRYAQIFACLNDDPGRRLPTVGLVCRLLCSEMEETVAAREYFSPHSPLIRYRLLELREDSQGPFLDHSLLLSRPIVSFLCGLATWESRINPFTRLVNPGRALPALILPEDVKNRLASLSSLPFVSLETIQKGLLFYFYGPRGAGKTTAAEALCHEWNLPLMTVDVEGMLNADLELRTSIGLVFRESFLRPAAVCFERFDLLLRDGEKAAQGRFELLNALRELSWLTILEGETPWYPPDDLRQHLFCAIEFPLPGCSLREKIWEAALQESGADSNGLDLPALAGRFIFSGRQIQEAVRLARSYALPRDPVDCRLTIGDLYAACRNQAGRDLARMAVKIQPRYAMKEIVLPPWQAEQLKSIIDRVRYRGVVHEEWGFEHRFSGDRGLKALFTGLSGTGKTMAAEVMAHELGLDLYKVNLATVVSKYVGETEKNLAQVFEAAERGNAVLFFDEADALFGKRTEVKDAHDRYANIETGYLLQKMEEHDGVVILATNLQKNMDEAFIRRLHFIVEFPLPAEEHRYRIWRGIFPAKTPLAEDIDFVFLARQFKITGGNIKNIALDAAFLAARAGETIGMKHLVQATRREFQKIGKMIREDDFGDYAGLVDAV
jgi:SpoVK/Ycf46/Vps4 family AAA+-type ATPase